MNNLTSIEKEALEFFNFSILNNNPLYIEDNESKSVFKGKWAIDIKVEKTLEYEKYLEENKEANNSNFLKNYYVCKVKGFELINELNKKGFNLTFIDQKIKKEYSTATGIDIIDIIISYNDVIGNIRISNKDILVSFDDVLFEEEAVDIENQVFQILKKYKFSESFEDVYYSALSNAYDDIKNLEYDVKYVNDIESIIEELTLAKKYLKSI